MICVLARQGVDIMVQGAFLQIRSCAHFQDVLSFSLLLCTFLLYLVMRHVHQSVTARVSTCDRKLCHLLICAHNLSDVLPGLRPEDEGLVDWSMPVELSKVRSDTMLASRHPK